jgi:hypothetical protein
MSPFEPHTKTAAVQQAMGEGGGGGGVRHWVVLATQKVVCHFGFKVHGVRMHSLPSQQASSSPYAALADAAILTLCGLVQLHAILLRHSQ